jgi:hypothetical protein
MKDSPNLTSKASIDSNIKGRGEAWMPLPKLLMGNYIYQSVCSEEPAEVIIANLNYLVIHFQI